MLGGIQCCAKAIVPSVQSFGLVRQNFPHSSLARCSGVGVLLNTLSQFQGVGDRRGKSLLHKWKFLHRLPLMGLIFESYL